MKESDVKKALRAYLKEIGAYQYWPVPMGYGATTVDVLVCYKGRFFAIETKRPGVKAPTFAQQCVMRDVAAAGGGVILENSVNLEATRESLPPEKRGEHEFRTRQAARLRHFEKIAKEG